MLLILLVSIAAISCQSEQVNIAPEPGMPDLQKFVVSEVIHTSNYTYLRAKEEDSEKWFAIPLKEVKVGETYYHGASMEMKNFASKELNRTFETIYFLEGISSTPVRAENILPAQDPEEDHHHISDNSQTVKTGTGAVTDKKNIKIETEKGSVSIADLFAGKKSFEGKKVSVKGQVTKFSTGILNKNWIHIQDGTEHGGKFDLTITSDQKVNIGDIVIFEGKITLDKDLGHGYFFELIMENAILKK